MSRLAFLDFKVDFAAPQIVNAYDEMPLWSAIFGLLLLEEVPLAGVRRVLDIACGTGFPLIELAERLGPTCEIHGVDVWRAGLTRASDKIANRKLQNVSVHETDAWQMAFEGGYFDLVVSNLGLNNFENRAGAVRESRRVLRHNGILALTTNLQGHMKELYEMFETVLVSDWRRGGP
jgi:arsenite methyltransferase